MPRSRRPSAMWLASSLWSSTTSTRIACASSLSWDHKPVTEPRAPVAGMSSVTAYDSPHDEPTTYRPGAAGGFGGRSRDRRLRPDRARLTHALHTAQPWGPSVPRVHRVHAPPRCADGRSLSPSRTRRADPGPTGEDTGNDHCVLELQSPDRVRRDDEGGRYAGPRGRNDLSAATRAAAG